MSIVVDFTVDAKKSEKLSFFDAEAQIVYRVYFPKTFVKVLYLNYVLCFFHFVVSFPAQIKPLLHATILARFCACK